MVQATILIMSLSLAVILIVAGFFEFKYGGYLKLSGFIIFLFVGVLTLVSPVEILSGEVTTTENFYVIQGNNTLLNTTSTISTNTYIENDNILNTVFGLILVLAGLYGALRSREDIMLEKEEDLN